MKVIHKPDGWLLLDHDGDTRIFASWGGGYLDGDSWRISSAAKLWPEEETEETLTYLTASGARYILPKHSRGQITGYNSTILAQALDAGLTVIEEDECLSINIAVENAENDKPTKS